MLKVFEELGMPFRLPREAYLTVGFILSLIMPKLP